MADTATDYIDPRQIGPVPEAVDMPGGKTVSPPKPMSDQDVQGFIKQKGDITADSVNRLRGLDKQRMDLASQQTPHPAAPTLQDIPKPPDTKPLNVFKEAQPALIFTTVMGALAMRNHGMGAMAAATGFLQGWHDGDKERMDRERQKWNDNVDAIKSENDVQKSRYDAAWNDTKLTQADKMAKISAIASSIGDEQTIHSMQAGNLDFAYKLQQDRNTAATKLWETNVRFGSGGAGDINENAMKVMVDQYLSGDKSVLQNIGRGTQGAKNIARFRNMLGDVMEQRGITGAQQAEKMAEFAGYQSAQRVLAQRQANLGVASQELTSFAGPALAASERLPRGQWVPINKLQQDAQRMASNPDLRELSNRNAGLISAYAQVISRTGVPTVHAQERAADLLNTADSPEAYQRAVDTLISEADLAEKAPDIIRERMRDRFLGNKPKDAPAAPSKSSPKVIRYDEQGNRIE